MRCLQIVAWLTLPAGLAAQATAGALAPCELAGGLPARCGGVSVPENPGEPEGRQLDLHVVLLPALSRDPAPDPVFFLAGGPGQAATDLIAPFSQLFAGLRESRDLVFVDQRGTGGSNPLQCTLADPEERLDLLLGFRMTPENLARCLDGLDADLRWYATSTAMDDLDRVRDALGYEQINLYGGSYGTRAALEYMRRHPGRTRTAVLHGVAPPPLKLPADFAPDAERALSLITEECRSDTACAAITPDLATSVRRVLQRLASVPADVAAAHPATGDTVHLTLTRDLFAGGVRMLLYGGPFTASLPRVARAAEDGDFTPFVTVLAPFADLLTTQLSLGMLLAVMCAEDVPFIDREATARAASSTFLGDGPMKETAELCRGWPAGTVPASFHAHVRSDIPALLITGEADPVTPPRHAEDAARHLSDALVVAVPFAGHLDSMGPCEAGIVYRFLEAGTTEGLDVSCSANRPRRQFVR